jgi:hypothetical protein
MSAMPDPTDTPSSTEPPSSAIGEPRASRRRLLQGGLAAAPVLMTLVSRPVLAQSTCTTPSGYVSANASTAGRGVACLGRTPGYWKQSQHFDDWRPPYYPTNVPGPGGHKATLFDSVFAPHYPKKTLLDVLDPQVVGGGPPNDVARHIVAAMLNVAAGWAPVLTVPVVKAMWSEYLNTGTFSPSSGASWNHGELMDYLLTTMPV